MSHICIVPHCGKPTTGRSNKCNAHRLAFRRHGHPLQGGIKVPEIAPYRSAIRRLWDANDASAIWTVIKARWSRCIGHAQSIVNDAASGRPFNLHQHQAAEELLRLDRNVPFQDLACTAMALKVFQYDRPHSFRDDRAYDFQLVRKVRALDELAVYKTWNHKRRAMHRVYRDLRPGAVEALAEYLKAAFGSAGLLLRDHEKARPRLEVTESRLMADAVAALR